MTTVGNRTGGLPQSIGSRAKRQAAERTAAAEVAYTAVFLLVVALAAACPRGAALLCGIGGITGRAAGRTASRSALRVWDRVHRGAGTEARMDQWATHSKKTSPPHRSSAPAVAGARRGRCDSPPR